MASLGRQPVQGKPVWAKTQAVDLEGNQLCIWWSLNICKKKEEDFCTPAGKKCLHKCSVVVSENPLRLCLAARSGNGGHAPGECPHERE